MRSNPLKWAGIETPHFRPIVESVHFTIKIVSEDARRAWGNSQEMMNDWGTCLGTVQKTLPNKWTEHELGGRQHGIRAQARAEMRSKHCPFKVRCLSSMSCEFSLLTTVFYYVDRFVASDTSTQHTPANAHTHTHSVALERANVSEQSRFINKIK